PSRLSGRLHFRSRSSAGELNLAWPIRHWRSLERTNGRYRRSRGRGEWRAIPSSDNRSRQNAFPPAQGWTPRRRSWRRCSASVSERGVLAAEPLPESLPNRKGENRGVGGNPDFRGRETGLNA